MAKILARTLFLLSLLAVVRLYSLESSWKLRTSQTAALRSLSSPIYFEFRKQLPSNGRSEIGFLTITACNIMTYNYQIDGSEIFLSYVSIGRSTRNCANGQISFLREQLDEAFYFYILYGTLLLKSPKDDLPLKFDIHSSAKTAPINGVWTITSAANGDANDPIVVVNGSRMIFCGGSHVNSYRVSNIVRINITNIQADTTCNSKILVGFNNSSLIYRVNNLLSPRTFTLFDSDVNPIMELTHVADFAANRIINSSSFAISSSFSNNTTSANNSVVRNSSVTNQSPSNGTNANGTNRTNGSLSIMNNTRTSNATAAITQTSNNINQTSASANRNASNTSNPQNNSSSNQQTTNPNSISSTPTPTYSLVTQASSIFGVWYPSPSVLPNQLKPNDIAVYQILINGAFMMLRGGCNTVISPYTFSSGSFTPTRLSITANSCPGNKDSILQSIIFNSSNIYYLSNGASPTIRIASNSNITQLILTPNAPSS